MEALQFCSKKKFFALLLLQHVLLMHISDVCPQPDSCAKPCKDPDGIFKPKCCRGDSVCTPDGDCERPCTKPCPEEANDPNFFDNRGNGRQPCCFGDKVCTPSGCRIKQNCSTTGQACSGDGDCCKGLICPLFIVSTRGTRTCAPPPKSDAGCLTSGASCSTFRTCCAGYHCRATKEGDKCVLYARGIRSCKKYGESCSGISGLFSRPNRCCGQYQCSGYFSGSCE